MSEADTVYVVDDDASVRHSLRRLVGSVGLRVRAFESAERFLRHKRPTSPACLVLDVRMPGISGLALQEKLAGEEPKLPIIFVSGHADIGIGVSAMKSGAVDFLTKPYREQDLLDAIHRALDRSRNSVEEWNERKQVLDRLALLTPRERDVYRFVITGMPNRHIATRLGISEKTVKVHRGRVMRKLGAWSIVDLIRFAWKAGE